MDERLAGPLAHASELERRDEELAGAIARMAELAERVAALRARATAVAAALESLPGELAANGEAANAATVAEHDAALALSVAEQRVATLEGSRRRRDELDQARRELARAGDDLADARARRRRLAERREQLQEEEHALRAERDRLHVEAAALAEALAETPRLPGLGSASPADGLAGVEEWGGRVRGALVVARGGLDAERDRLVTEANTLGASVLGEAIGASSVALVRRRLERALAPGTPGA